MTVTLTIIDGQLKGKSYKFDSRNICWAGRDSNCKILFPEDREHGQVSRLHCLLDIDPPKISVRDFNSKHGTYVDTVLVGKRESGQAAPQGINADVKPVEKNLYSGSIIGIGNVHIKVTISGEQPDYSPPPTPQPPKAMRIVADKAIAFIKNWLEIPDRTPASQREKQAIGGYKIVKELGAGGYGQVFLAENAQGKRIAIKVMLAEVAATPAKVKMFEREIDNAKALNHPNVVRLTDNGFDPGNNCLYYAMEYCAGENLHTFIHKMGGILDLPLTKRLIFQLLDGLEYTHNAEIPYIRLADGSFGKGIGLVHRDLKLSNIMIAKSNLGQIAKIGDFGLAKAFDLAGLSGHTMSGDGFRGTPHFMCRKQVLEFQQAKPEVDIWAAAACLYYMLTNQYPRKFGKGEGWEVLLERDVIPIRDRNSDIPAPLAIVIDRALHECSKTSTTLHYQRVQDFKADLAIAFDEILD
jgi:eukaryotic-like serine/threonine-protein kinase